jgi:hypothetical protein
LFRTCWWEIAKPLIPPLKVRPQGGGTQDTPDETLLAAIIYVLVSGCAWRPCLRASASRSPLLTAGSGLAISHKRSGTIQLHVPRPIPGQRSPHHVGHGLTDRFRMKFVVGIGSWVLCRQDLLGVC